MKSVMSHDFSRIPRTDIEVSTFDRSHGVKTAFDSGYLVPIYLDEVVPGDTFAVDATLVSKMLSPMVSAPMDNLFLDTFWFYVPSRLLWNNFTRMMGERPNPKDSIDYLVPQINSGSGFAVGSLADYFGIPTGVPNLSVNALPFRAYAKIWDDWFRCEFLQDCIINKYEDLGDGNPNNVDWLALRRRGKRHDYFTSALPWPQLGAGVELPLQGNAPVVGNGLGLALTYAPGDVSGVQYLTGSDGSDRAALSQYYTHSAYPNGVALGDASAVANSDQHAWGALGVVQDPARSGLVADLSKTSAATINSLRMAFQLQRMMERDARGGTRYVEIIRQHFRTICPDARLQRSEYLGGSSDLINIHQLVQTSSTDSTTPQGNRVSNADGFAKCGWTKSFSEHGYVIGLVNVRADLNYQQGLNRIWSRRVRYDFYWPTLAHLGEQAVLNKEIFAQGVDVKDSKGTPIDDLPFGYQERYAEYRYHPSIITGKLRSTAQGTLDVWHLAQKFDALPTLSKEFIEDNPPIGRLLAVTTGEPQFLLDCYIGCKCTRPMPLYSVPGLIDHF